MNEEKKKSTTGSILAMLALIVCLVAGVKVIFWGIEKAVTPPAEDHYITVSQENGRGSSYGLRTMEADERQMSDIQLWLAKVTAEKAEDTCCWLYRQQQDDYVLYLPREDRALTSEDLTADEKRQEDGEITLVLRIRTPEDAAQVKAEEQLLCINTTSDKWRGIRVRVLLDGREQTVQKLVSDGTELHSVEEVYIGRF